MSLLTDAIRVHGTQLGKSFADKGVEYKTLPAIKIGRMCVHKHYTSKGIGTYMMYFAMKLLLEVNERVGCRFIVLDAKTQTNAVRFYKKFGFEVLKHSGQSRKKFKDDGDSLIIFLILISTLKNPSVVNTSGRILSLSS